MRGARRGSRGTRSAAVSGRDRPANLRERFEARVATLAQAPDDADQRVSPHADRAEGAQVPRGRDAEVLLRRRLGEAAGLQARRKVERRRRDTTTSGREVIQSCRWISLEVSNGGQPNEQSNADPNSRRFR